jgi:hypothetical protein
MQMTSSDAFSTATRRCSPTVLRIRGSFLGASHESSPACGTQLRPFDQQIVRLHQVYGSLPVKGSEAVVVLRDGILFSFMGHSFLPSQVPTPGPLRDPSVVEVAAEVATGLPLQAVDRFFDPHRGAVISVFAVEGGNIRIEWDEAVDVEVRRWRNVSSLSLVPKSTTVQKYALEFAPNGIQTVTVNVDHRPLTGSNDNFCLDHGSDLQDGEPKLCRVNSDSDNCTAPHCKPHPDGSSSVYLGFPTTDDGTIMNLYFWMHDLSVFANHWWTLYDAAWPWFRTVTSKT